MQNNEANAMRRTGFFITATAALAMALAPSVADARAGGGSSSGSRGSKTYSAPPSTSTAPTTAQPMQRTQTPQQQPGAATPAAGAAAAAPSRAGTFMTGLAGGMLGMGLAGMLMGGGFFGGGMGGAGFLGLLLQLALIGGMVYLGFRLFRMFRGQSAQQPALAMGPQGMARDMMDGQPGRPMGGGGGGARMAGAMPSIEVAPADFQQFEQVLVGIQDAWTKRDLPAMQRMATPEMIGYFGELLGDHDRRGVRNSVTQVRLLSGDLAEAWNEGDRDYATVAMKFGMIDVTTDQSGKVVDGDPNQPTTATEVWTFLRVRGGRWVLSAIQQVG